MIISAANVVNLTLMRGVRREHELVVRAALGAGVRAAAAAAARRESPAHAHGRRVRRAHRHRRREAARLARRALLAARERDPARRRGRLASRSRCRSRSRCCSRSWRRCRRKGSSRRWISAGVRRMSGGCRKQRLQRGLVVAQIAVSVVLLAGAGLLTRTMIQLSEVNTGLRDRGGARRSRCRSSS